MNNQFMSYDYKELTIHNDLDMYHLDALECLGWEIDENKSEAQKQYVLRRPRHIVNKTELTRLERNLNSCLYEITQLQKSVHSYATTIAITIGIIGTAFMACSTFAAVQEPPLIIPCIIFAVPGFIGWILPYIVYKKYKVKRYEKIQPFVEKKYDEIDQICNKAMQLKEL